MLWLCNDSPLTTILNIYKLWALHSGPHPTKTGKNMSKQNKQKYNVCSASCLSSVLLFSKIAVAAMRTNSCTTLPLSPSCRYPSIPREFVQRDVFHVFADVVFWPIRSAKVFSAKLSMLSMPSLFPLSSLPSSLRRAVLFEGSLKQKIVRLARNNCCDQRICEY